ncbi:MAG: cyanophycinase [Planctomycetota bacterium]|nr:cyanophycinase [Planctomycetota bacterium]
MVAHTNLPAVALMCLTLFAACATHRTSETHRSGTLLIVGGGLDDDSRPIYERFVELAAARGAANIVIATAATGTEEDEVVDKTEALRVWAPGIPVCAIRRETPTNETVAAIDAATAMLFTGGDQKRITTRYRPDDRDTPEWLAMQRLLARGGVIAGCSAGDAMMGDVMMLSGGSASALGIAPKEVGAGEPPVLGPQVGPGMRFLPWAMTDSHFFERDRVGRFVAALEASHIRLGIGVGEDGCVEIDLSSGELRGIGVSEALLVDVAHLTRDGLTRRGLLARVVAQGDRVSLVHRLALTPAPPMKHAMSVRKVPVVEPGQNRQLASWRLFRCAARADNGAEQLQLDGWQITAWPMGDGEVAFELGPQ